MRVENLDFYTEHRGELTLNQDNWTYNTSTQKMRTREQCPFEKELAQGRSDLEKTSKTLFSLHFVTRIFGTRPKCLAPKYSFAASTGTEKYSFAGSTGTNQGKTT